MKRCPVCGGQGYTYEGLGSCESCPDESCRGPYRNKNCWKLKETCDFCKGKGFVPDDSGVTAYDIFYKNGERRS